MGLAAQTKAEKRFCEETPLERPTDDAMLRRAVDILQAARKIPRAGSIEMTDDTITIHVVNQQGWEAWAEYVQCVFGPSLPDYKN